MKVSAKGVFGGGEGSEGYAYWRHEGCGRFFSDPFRSLMDMSVAEYSAVDFPPSLLLLDLLD